MVNAVILFIFIGNVDVVVLNDINTSVLSLNPKKRPAFKGLIYNTFITKFLNWVTNWEFNWFLIWFLITF
jgi:hypothetical protein